MINPGSYPASNDCQVVQYLSFEIYLCITPRTKYLLGDTSCFSLKLKLEANFQRRQSVKHLNWLYDKSFSQSLYSM